MNSFIGKWLIILGSVTLIFGLLFLLSPKIPFVGKLPGDIFIERKNVIIFIPITTMILLSLILTLFLNLVSKK